MYEVETTRILKFSLSKFYLFANWCTSELP